MAPASTDPPDQGGAGGTASDRVTRSGAATAPPALVLAGLVVCTVVGTGLSAAVAQSPLIDNRLSVQALLLAWLPLWVLGVLLVRLLPARWALVACVVAAVALRGAALTGPPRLSDDLYRYAWDAKVQLTGASPYERAPLDPSLAPLRERWQFPDLAESDATLINRPSARTIYPPLAQVWFVVVRLVTGGAMGERPWQAASAVVDLGLCGLLAVGLRRLGHDPLLAAWWALSPVAVVELAQSAHVDGLAVVLSVAGVLVARRRPGLAGGLIGAAAMVKLYPALLLVAAARRRPLLAGSCFTAVCAAAYLPHVVAAGPKVLGYLPDYLREERYDQGGRFLLLSLTRLPEELLPILAAVVLGAAVLLVWRADLPAVRAAPLLLGALLLVATPVQPWYAVSVAALGLLDRAWWWSVLAVVGIPYYVSVLFDDPDADLHGQLAYGVALVVVVAAELVRRQRGRQVDGPVVGAAASAPVTSGSA